MTGSQSRSRITPSSLLVNSKDSVQAGVLKNSPICFSRGFKFQSFGYASTGTCCFPPILHCYCPLKFKTINLGCLTFPKQYYLLIRALKCSYLHQFSALPFKTLIKLTYITECRYAQSRGRGRHGHCWSVDASHHFFQSSYRSEGIRSHGQAQVAPEQQAFFTSRTCSVDFHALVVSLLNIHRPARSPQFC